MAYTPHPGELDTLVTIGRTVNEINENGHPVPTDQTVCRVWASVRDASSSYGHSGDADMSRVGLRFVIRYRDDVTPGMYVEYEGEKRHIETTGTLGFRKMYKELFTSSQKGVK